MITVVENIGKTTIPSVMVTDKDGKFLIEAAQYLHSKGLESMAVIEMLNIPAILDSPAMGFTGHPSIRAGEKLMHIVGSGSWGAVLSRNENNEWQLYIVPKADLQNVSPWGISTSKNQHITSSNAFTFNPVNVYHQMISENCPSVVTNVNNVVKLEKFD